MLKVGDRLVCYQNKNTFDNGNDEYDISAVYNIDSIYNILEIEVDKIFVSSEYELPEWFYIDIENNIWHYKNWFVTLKSIRNAKLKRLDNL